MQLNDKRVVVGIVLALLLACGAGYYVGNGRVQQAEGNLTKVSAENAELKKQLDAAKLKSDGISAELSKMKDQIKYSPVVESYVLDSIRRAGIEDPGQLIEDLTKNPSVIPEEPVLGGTMQFNRVVLIDEHWVYGAYEDGHVAGSAIFQWEIRDSGIIWTPILIFKE